jgi:hypothetical protein
MFGGLGNDAIDVAYRYQDTQRLADGVPDLVDCGLGTDSVRQEKGLDRVVASCARAFPW